MPSCVIGRRISGSSTVASAAAIASSMVVAGADMRPSYVGVCRHPACRHAGEESITTRGLSGPARRVAESVMRRAPGPLRRAASSHLRRRRGSSESTASSGSSGSDKRAQRLADLLALGLGAPLGRLVQLFGDPGQLGAQEVAGGDLAERDPQRRDLPGQILGVRLLRRRPPPVLVRRHPVAVGLPVLREQDQRRRIGGLQRQDQRQEREGVRVELPARPGSACSRRPRPG